MAASAVFAIGAASAQPDQGPQPDRDPNGYYSQNDQNGYYDRNGQYQHHSDDRDRRYLRDNNGYGPPPPPQGAYYEQGRYEEIVIAGMRRPAQSAPRMAIIPITLLFSRPLSNIG